MAMSVISKRAIIEASLLLIDNEGTQALTMRKLAAQLNIEAPSLYYYVKNKDQLCQLIVDTLVSRSLISAVVSDTASQCLQNIAYAYRAILQSHPGAMPLAVAYPAQYIVISEYIAATPVLQCDAKAVFAVPSIFAFVAAHALSEAQTTQATDFYNQWFLYGVAALTR